MVGIGVPSYGRSDLRIATVRCPSLVGGVFNADIIPPSCWRRLPGPLKRYERKLKREQRKLSRKVLKSKNWFKQKHKVERIHYRIACIRNDAHHKATTDIVNRASGIAVETLKVTNMLKNRKLAKTLADSALGGFLQKLRTKADALGIPVTEASQFFASSKTCSSCGYKKEDLTLKDRTYHCSQCGVSIDRDINAAINLKQLAVG